MQFLKLYFKGLCFQPLKAVIKKLKRLKKL